ncbi:MAG: Gfo/Idh/MocA family oxidoreductase [Actinobacteria bacterium]|nr:Gfo/Idh/MocA family oxidoreductase [Actinomycetota bacterium]
MGVRVGFFGGGLIATYHGKMLHAGAPDADIALVYDPDIDKAERFAAASGAKVAATETEVLDGSDAIYVCTWTTEHRRLVEQAAARGLPIFCEKPLAVTEADAGAMVDAVTKAGVVNQVGLVLRDSPSFLFLHHLVRQERNGAVMSVVFRDDQYIPIQGMYGSTWRADPARAGAGTLLEHSIHDLDLLEWLCGTITGVAAQTGAFHQIAGIEDLAVVTVRYASGAVGSLTSVWHDLLERPSLRRVEVLCERGFFVLEGDVWGPVRWTLPGDEGSVEGEALAAELDRAGIARRNPDAAFVESVMAGTPAHPDFAIALRPHRLVDAIYRSARAGGAPVSLVRA